MAVGKATILNLANGTHWQGGEGGWAAARIRESTGPSSAYFLSVPAARIEGMSSTGLLYWRECSRIGGFCQRPFNDRRGFQPSSDRSSSWLPLTQNLANRAIVRSTISVDLETMMDLRLNRPNQCRWRQ